MAALLLLGVSRRVTATPSSVGASGGMMKGSTRVFFTIGWPLLLGLHVSISPTGCPLCHLPCRRRAALTQRARSEITTHQTMAQYSWAACARVIVATGVVRNIPTDECAGSVSHHRSETACSGRF